MPFKSAQVMIRQTTGIAVSFVDILKRLRRTPTNSFRWLQIASDDFRICEVQISSDFFR